MGTESARRYDAQVVHYIRKTVNYNDTGIASGVEAGAFPAGAHVVCGSCTVRTAFNAGTTNVLTFGTSGGSYADIFAAGDITEGTPAGYLLVAAGAIYCAAATVVGPKYTQSGTAATTGVATFTVGFSVDNDG